jgi:phage terminase large subunit
MEVTTSRPTLNPNLRPFWEAKKAPDGNPIRNRVLYGGRDSSKTWDVGGWCVFLACNFRLRILCARQFQSNIDESVYALLKIQIERFNLGAQFDIQKNRIIHRITETEFLFYGLARSIDEAKGLEGIDILWLEEAHNLTKKQWDIMEPTIRKEGSQIFVVFNPQLATDFAYKHFVVDPPPGTLIRHINYDENPFLSNTSRMIIEALKKKDFEEYQHKYLGQPLENDDSVIIKRSWILASIDAHKKLGIEPTGYKRIGFDVADDGADKCAMVYAHGPLASWSDLWKAREDELLKSCTRVWKAAQERQASVTYDSIGVGASAGAKFGELNQTVVDGRVQYNKFNAGSAVFNPEAKYSEQVKNKDQFSNIKAQAWWIVADRFKNTYNAVQNGKQFNEDELIFIDGNMPNLNMLIDELSTPKRDFDQNGKVKVESKKDLAKRDVPSPNIADALIMAFAPGITPMTISKDAMNKFLSMGKTR